MVIVKNRAYELMSVNGCTVQRREIVELMSTHEETDTRVVIYAMYGEKEGYAAVKVRSPDTDIFFILLHHSTKIKSEVFFDTGSGNKRKLLNITKIATKLGNSVVGHC